MFRNKNIIITGASHGLGKLTAMNFVMKHANVCICGRNEKDLLTAAEDIRQRINDPEQRIAVCRTDISDIKEIDNLFEHCLAEFGSLDVLVNNAGIQGPIGSIEDNNWEEWEKTIKTDLVGPAYCMRKAITIFKSQNRRGKIVNISGGGATGSRPYFSAYAAAKTGIVRLTETLSDETKEYDIDINAVAPGALNTRILDEIINSGISRYSKKAYDQALKQKKEGGASVQKAVDLIMFLSGSESDGISGKLISAVWDDWKNMGQMSLADTDLFTLRRIIK